MSVSKCICIIQASQSEVYTKCTCSAIIEIIAHVSAKENIQFASPSSFLLLSRYMHCVITFTGNGHGQSW